MCEMGFDLIGSYGWSLRSLQGEVEQPKWRVLGCGFWWVVSD